MRARKIDLAFLALWAAILLASPIFKASAKFCGWPDFQRRAIEENRILAPRPNFKSLPLRQWGRAVDAWYDDNFAWRSDIIRLYKSFLFNVAMCPIGDQVPGYGGMVFRRNGTWPEIEDYLGAIRMDNQMRSDWRTLIEGRVAWAEAHGAHYIEAIAPVKIQTHSERAPWAIRNMPGASSRIQLEDALRGSFAETNVLFFTREFRKEAARGREMFYLEDHHVSAFGCWRLYSGIVARLRDLWYPWLDMTPYYDEPPESVRERREAGAYTNPETRRLVVSSPGYSPCNVPDIGIFMDNPQFPMCPVYVRRPGIGLYLAMRHDSLLRFPLSSWRRGCAHEIAIPFGNGFSDIAMFIFKRFSTEELEGIVGPRVPDVIIEEFPECKISLGAFGLDETMRRAAEFGRAQPLESGSAASGHTLALAVFENPKKEEEGAELRAEIVDAEGHVVASEPVAPGARRAIFFGAIEGKAPFSAELRGGRADGKRIELRLSP